MNMNNLDFEFQDTDLDPIGMQWFIYTIQDGTVEDAMVLKLKFPECKIKLFAL
jgi:hypothetical protein